MNNSSWTIHGPARMSYCNASLIRTGPITPSKSIYVYTLWLILYILICLPQHSPGGCFCEVVCLLQGITMELIPMLVAVKHSLVLVLMEQLHNPLSQYFNRVIQCIASIKLG